MGLVRFLTMHYYILLSYFSQLRIYGLWMHSAKTGIILFRNTFLAAAPYFQVRFQSSEWALKNYQPTILSVSSITNLGSMLILSKLHKNAAYSKRIVSSLIIFIIIFSLLAISTIVFEKVSAGFYFVFLMIMVFWSSLATGVNQNGVFSFASGFGRPEYMQAIMTGHGVAGVLPCVVQIISVLAVPGQKADNPGSAPQVSSKSVFAYFITATFISALALGSFSYLRHLSGITVKTSHGSNMETASDTTLLKTFGLWATFKKLFWLALTIFLSFSITAVFPVFTATIESVHDPKNRPRILEPATFIPLGFLFWNAGDFIGRASVLVPQLRLVHHPILLLVFAISRLVFIPLYNLCNIGGRGAVVRSDAFYLIVVQLLFGITNGYVGTCAIVSTKEYVAVEEREAAGGFMSMMFVAGLTVGSFLSFLAAGA
jgi:solute carrier family 29 (equilibrative nucleoside transporter), member 1/2/3